VAVSFSVERARAAQRLIASRIVAEDRVGEPSTVCGLDVAFRKGLAVGAAVITRYGTRKVLDKAVAKVEVKVPYIPTLLAFREMPAIYAAFKRLRVRPDVVMVDGHGRARQLRVGIASHFGVVARIPSIGVAKKVLCGEVADVGLPYKAIVDRGEVVGAVVERKASRLYVSTGNMVTLETAVKCVLDNLWRRLPEPVMRAHELATSIARSL